MKLDANQCLIALVAAMSALTIRAQSTPALPRFEVASIKLCQGGEAEPGKKASAGGGRIRWDPQRLTEECQSVDNLIRDAYLAYPDGQAWVSDSRQEASPDPSGVSCTGCGREIPPFSGRTYYQEIQGSPAWADSERYTINAKAEHPTTPEMMRGPMMQSLLEERFHLKIRRATKDTPIYELTVAAGGPKLQPSHEGSCIAFSEVIKLTNGAPSKYRGLPLCDGWNSRDGQTTFFMPETDYAATAKAFQRALPKIGLKLQPASGAGAFLVIDHVERPSRN